MAQWSDQKWVSIRNPNMSTPELCGLAPSLSWLEPNSHKHLCTTCVWPRAFLLHVTCLTNCTHLKGSLKDLPNIWDTHMHGCRLARCDLLDLFTPIREGDVFLAHGSVTQGWERWSSLLMKKPSGFFAKKVLTLGSSHYTLAAHWAALKELREGAVQGCD